MRFLVGVLTLAVVAANTGSSAFKLEDLMALGGSQEARNQIGDIIAKVMLDFLKNKLTDPMLLINELSIPTIIETDSFKMTGALNVSKASLLDHHGLEITKSDASIIPLGINFDFSLRSLRFMCDYVIIEEIETTLLPITLYGAGPFLLNLQEMAFGVKATMLPTITGTVKIMSLDYWIDIWGIKCRIDGLFSDMDPSGELNEAVNILINSYAARLFNSFEAGYHDRLREGVKVMANEFLANVTWEDLIGNGTSRGVVPMTLPFFDL